MKSIYKIEYIPCESQFTVNQTIMDTECAICTEKFTKQTRKKIVCNNCNFEACLSCVKSYFKSGETHPSCMNCFEKFSEEFLYDNFPKNYINKDIKEIKQNLLFEQEKQLLPATQDVAKYAEHVDVVENSIKDDEKALLELHKKMHELNKNLGKKKILVQKFYRDYIIPTNEGDEEGSSTSSASKEVNVFLKHCPCNDCTGYLSTQWKCGMCNVRVCKDCLEIKEDDHVCNQDNVATARVIKESTKPCPSCGTSIGKIYGCNHMWCTHCKTGFDWRTRKIITGNNTNPHYYEWLRQNGNDSRELSDVVCGGIPYLHTVNTLLYKSYGQFPQKSAHIYMFHRLIEHVHVIELRETSEINNIDLRVKLLRKQISSEKFKQLVLTRVKSQRNKNNKQMIFLTLRDAGSDIMQRFIAKTEKKHETILDTSTEIQNLIKYINTAFENLSIKYSCSSHCISIRKNRLGTRQEYVIEPYKAK